MITYRVSADDIAAGSLSFGELIDIADATGIDPEEMSTLLAVNGRGAQRLRLLVGLAWVVNRRTQPELTYTEVLAGQVEVIGTPDPKGRRARSAQQSSPQA